MSGIDSEEATLHRYSVRNISGLDRLFRPLNATELASQNPTQTQPMS